MKNSATIFLSLFFFLFSVNLFADETEPNDACTNADVILSLGVYSGSDIGSSSLGDKDYFSFEVEDNGELNITIVNDNTRVLNYSPITTSCPTTKPNSLAKDSSVTLSIAATSAGTYYIFLEGSVSNKASNYEISAIFTPNVPSAGGDLKITKESSVDEVLIYDPFYYTINVSNIGDTNESNVSITDTLPTGMSVDLNETHIASPDWTCSGTSGTTTCLLSGILTSGDLSTLTLHVNAPSAEGNITNSVTVTSNGTDIDLTNNTATDITYVTAEVDSGEHLCYTDTTDLTIGLNAAKCEQIGNFWFGSNCTASVIVSEVNATDKLSDITVFKMYAPDTSSGSCTYSATTSAGASADTCNNILNALDFGSYTEGYTVTLNQTDVNNIQIEMEDFDTDKNPRIDGVAMFADYWTEDGFHHFGRIYDCNGSSEGGVEITTSADVIDTSIGTDDTIAGYYNTSTDTTSNGTNIKYIQTMIAGDTTREITGVHLNLSGETIRYVYQGTESPAIAYSIIPYLTDDTCSLNFENIIDPNTNQQLIIDVPNNAYSANGTMIVSSSAREAARMQLIFVDPNSLSVEGQQCLANSSTTGNFARLAQCVNSEVQYKTAFGQDAWDRCGADSGLPCQSRNNGEADPTDPTYDPLTDYIYTNELGCYMCTFNIRPVCASDNFAIRPNRFDVNITDDQTFISGAAINLQFEAEQADNVTPTLDYNELEGDSFSVDTNMTDATKSCQIKVDLMNDVQFIDGIDTDDFYFNDVGKDLNFTVAEINGSEYAYVDVNDTPDIDRFITPFVRNINVIPDRFNIEANLTDHNSDHNFTYLHDINQYDTDDNYSMASALTIDIQAVGADDNITRNYMETCYAEDTNLTLAMSSTDITYPGAVQPLTQFLYYNPAEDDESLDSGEGSYTLPSLSGITSLPIKNIPSTFSADAPDGNGTAFVEYRLNFDRKIHLVVNPFTVDLNNVNIIETNVTTPPVSGTTGTLTDQKATYQYARSRSSKFFYEDIDTQNVNTPIMIDVYCDLSFTACESLNIDTVNGQINEVDWWLSLWHDKTNNDGNITLMEGAVTEGNSTDWSVTPTVNIVANATDVNIIVDRGTNPTRPLTVEIELDRTNPTDTNHWLIYNEETDNIIQASPSPFYKVRFIGTSGWAGHGKTGYVVDSNVSIKKNRRMEW